MSKAGKKMIAGAKEALAVARGKKFPTSVTQFGYMVWRPSCGLVGLLHDSKGMADLWCVGAGDNKGSKVFRVRVSTVSRGQ